MSGGVRVDGIVSSRNIFSEQAVWRQSERYGRASELSSVLSQIEPLLTIDSDSGIAASLDELYNSFSALSVTPNDLLAREDVLRQAASLSNEFNFAASSLAQEQDHAGTEIRSIVDNINALAEEICTLNQEYREDYRNVDDAGLDARMYAALEELSGLVDFDTIRQSDGTFTVLLGGETPLVIGDKTFAVEADLSGDQAEILDFSGKQITDQVSSGSLAGILEFHNDLLPSYLSDLNRLAASVADRFNAQLAAGVDLDGLAPTTDLFEYDPLNPAASLSITDIQPSEIAAATSDAVGGNTNALALANLASSEQIDGLTFTEFYGELCARVGADVDTAESDDISASLLLSQARYLRDRGSAVNLDEEAAVLLQYQRAYQATAQMISILNEMTGVVMELL
jgi:flagellar hook-associated protein 1 FlgK